MEEEEDRILLSSLGVKSANPEDIERDVLEKVYIISFCLFTFLFVICILVRVLLLLFPLKSISKFN